ncbi:MAG: hypothetical protein HYS40_06730 [Gemmatimonadetes bacterium]|nr:hypothetical protein [Gemmatimonadota bacterium]
MAATRRPWFSALSLLAGSLLLSINGVRHPALVGDGAAELSAIAVAGAWSAIHWGFLFGFPLVVAGLAGVWSRHLETDGAQAARAGICLAVFGYALAAVGVLFMVGAGAALADAYQRADLGLTATHAVFVYDMLRPFALASIRAAAFVISLGTCAFGWAVVVGGVDPRALGYLGVVLGAVGAAVAVVLPETAPNVILGTVLATVWQLLLAVTMLWRDRAPTAA